MTARFTLPTRVALLAALLLLGSMPAIADATTTRRRDSGGHVICVKRDKATKCQTEGGAIQRFIPKASSTPMKVL